jgi:hypothetical protein
MSNYYFIDARTHCPSQYTLIPILSHPYAYPFKSDAPTIENNMKQVNGN